MAEKGLKKTIILMLFCFLLSKTDCCASESKSISYDANLPWTISADTDVVASVVISENANKISYDFNSGNWIELYNNIFADLDISASDAIKFYFKGSGSENHLKLQIYDTDGDVFDRKIEKVTDISQWTEMIVPFSSLSCWPGMGNGVLDTKKISKLAFAVTPSDGGSGSIAIDKIESYKFDTNDFLLVDSFDFGIPPNEAGGNEGIMSQDGLYNPTVSYTTDKYEGIYALLLTYNLPPAKWCGYYIFLSSAGDSGYRNLSLYTHLKFYVKSDVAERKFKIELNDISTTTKSVQLAAYLPTGTSTTYQEVLVPLSDFTNLISTAVKQINFVFDQDPLAGIVYIDRIGFTSGGTNSSSAIGLIDSMNSYCKTSGWVNYGKDEDKEITTTKIANVAGLSDDAIGLQYSFNRLPANIDDWVVLERDWGTNIANSDTIWFQYKGSGANNNLEFKIADKNETTFYRKFFNITNTNNVWNDMLIPFEEFSLLKSGKDLQGNIVDTLDLKKIKTISFVVSRNTGGAGTVSVRNLYDINKDLLVTVQAEKIIKLFTIVNNPFSPNGDGIKDGAVFAYLLSEAASVKLVIYSLAGDIVYEEDKSQQNANTLYSIEWRGNNNSGSIVSNGMYFYQLTAETATKKDKTTNVIAVLR
ncbi:MAG: CIA30 family protein [Elusimicrobiota bacterium]